MEIPCYQASYLTPLVSPVKEAGSLSARTLKGDDVDGRMGPAVAYHKVLIHGEKRVQISCVIQ